MLLPCSRNARPPKGLVRRPQLEQHGCPAAMKLKSYKEKGKSKESSQGALFARRTRTMKRCSPGRRARLGALGVGRVRNLRAVEGNLGHPLQYWGEG